MAENMPLGARTSGAQPGGRLQRKTETGGRLQRGVVVVWSFELWDGVDDEAVVTAPNGYRMGRRVAFWVPFASFAFFIMHQRRSESLRLREKEGFFSQHPLASLWPQGKIRTVRVLDQVRAGRVGFLLAVLPGPDCCAP